MRIAILNCNSFSADFARRFPDDGHKVVAGLQPLRPDWELEVWPVHADAFPPQPEAYDGWLMTGSVASVHDGEPWMLRLAALLRDRHARRVPLAGLCFGHQMLAHALGGRVGPSPGGWRIGTAPTQFAEQPTWMDPPQAGIRLFAAHEEQVLQLPPGARVLGGDIFAPIGAMAIGDHVFSSQYHPELTREFMLALLEAFADTWPAALVAQARQQVAEPVDAPLFMRWMAQFFEAAGQARG